MMKSFVKERINSEIVYGPKNRCICISMGPANSFNITNLVELINHVKDAEAEQGTQLFSNGQFGQTSFLRKPRRTKKDTQWSCELLVVPSADGKQQFWTSHEDIMMSFTDNDVGNLIVQKGVASIAPCAQDLPN